MDDANGFVIEDGVLEEYTGPGGEVVIPQGVTRIGEWAFFWLHQSAQRDHSAGRDKDGGSCV